jgi:hypothetical protein
VAHTRCTNVGPPFETSTAGLDTGAVSLPHSHLEREFFIDNLLVRIHFIIEIILVDRPCAMGVWISFPRQPYIYLPRFASHFALESLNRGKCNHPERRRWSARGTLGHVGGGGSSRSSIAVLVLTFPSWCFATRFARAGMIR